MLTIIKKKDGYHVVSKTTGQSFGGPYLTKGGALRRMRKIQHFQSINPLHTLFN